PVTRNTHRKWIVAMFRWCRKRELLPMDVTTAAEKTDLAEEGESEISITTAAVLQQVFAGVTERAPAEKVDEYICAIALAAGLGMRRGEVHGQDWSDINLERGSLRVTAAKPKTPARRLVPISDAAAEWLRPRAKESGPVCSNLALDRVRDICRTAGVELAENVFRHTWISARVETTGDIPRTAREAGTSVRMIHHHYLELMHREDAEGWLAVAP